MIYRHALKNSLLPVVTVLGMLIPLMLGATVVVEYVFALPGSAAWPSARRFFEITPW